VASKQDRRLDALRFTATGVIFAEKMDARV
jgi:hypothetical protein